MQEWMTTVTEAERKKQTEEMMAGWQKWIADHENAVLDKGLPLGKTKRVTKGGVTDTKNDFNYWIILEADSHQAAAQMLEKHPHLDIPDAYIEVMDSSRTPGM